MRQICSDTPLPRYNRDSGVDVEPDPIAPLLAREEARHHSELTATRDQIIEMLGSPIPSLLTALDDDLAAVAMATVEAMSTLRRARAVELGPTTSAPRPEIDHITGAIGEYLTQVARLTRSTLAIHLTLEAQARAARC